MRQFLNDRHGPDRHRPPATPGRRRYRGCVHRCYWARSVAIDPGLDLKVDTWTSGTGNAYVGVKAAGTLGSTCGNRYGRQDQVLLALGEPGRPEPQPACLVGLRPSRRPTTSIVNFTVPIVSFTTREKPAIGISLDAFGDLSLYLAVGSRASHRSGTSSRRTVTAELTAGWRDTLDDAIRHVRQIDTVRVTRWTVDFGDGSAETFPGDGSDRLVTTHAYGPGEFEAVVTAQVVGEAYGAFFTPDGVPYEQLVPFSSTSATARRASRNARSSMAPVVNVGGSPSGRCRMDRRSPLTRTATTRSAGRAVSVRAVSCGRSSSRRASCVSGGVVIGGATTRLVSYRYTAGANNAADATRSGQLRARRADRHPVGHALGGRRLVSDPADAGGRDDL